MQRDQKNGDLDAMAVAIRNVVSTHFGLQAYAIALIRPGSICRTTSGKIQRYQCKREFQAGELKKV